MKKQIKKFASLGLAAAMVVTLPVPSNVVVQNVSAVAYRSLTDSTLKIDPTGLASGALNGTTVNGFSFVDTSSTAKLVTENNSATFGNEYIGKISYTKRLKTNGKSQSSNNISFTTTGATKLLIAANAGSRKLTIGTTLNAKDVFEVTLTDTKDVTVEGTKVNKLYYVDIPEAGTYYLNYPDNGIYIFDIHELTDTDFADYTAVIEAKANVPANLSYYEGGDAVEAAIAAVVSGKLYSEQSVVDGWADVINEAVEALVEKDADYTAVNEALAAVEALNLEEYKPETVTPLTEAVEAVVTGYKMSQQEAVNAMAQAINDAIAGLVGLGEEDNADYTAVDEALEAVPENYNNEYVYTEESRTAVTEAVNAVVRNLKESQQADVDAMAQAINTAVAGLTKVPVNFDAKTFEGITPFTDVEINGVVIHGMSISDNTAYFGSEYGNVNYTKRLQSGGATSSSKYIKVILDHDATLIIAARTASGTSERTIGISTTEAATGNLYSRNLLDAQAITDEGVGKIFPLWYVTLEAGTYYVSTNNGINIYNIHEATAQDMADYSKVVAAMAKVTEAGALNAYTEESALALSTAVNAVVAGKTFAEQSVVDGWATAIEAAVEGLVAAAPTDGLVEDGEGNLVYYLDGEAQLDYTGIVEFEEKEYYVENGVFNSAVNGLVQKEDSKWYCVVDGMVDYTFTGMKYFAKASNWYYVENGIVNSTFNGLVAIEEKGIVCLVANGKMNKNFTNLYYDEETESWLYVKDGVVKEDYTGAVYYNKSQIYYSVVNGAVDFTYTGLMKCAEDGKTYYMVNGKSQSKYTGLVYSEEKDNTYYVSEGVVDNEFTDIVYNKADQTWYNVKKGVVTKNFTGMAKYSVSNKYYYIVDGKKVNFTGNVQIGEYMWKVENGRIIEKIV